MNHNTLALAPADPSDSDNNLEIPAKLRDLTPETARMVMGNIGSEVHEHNAPVETLKMIHEELSITPEATLDPEALSETGMSRDDEQRFLDIGSEASMSQEGYVSSGVEAPVTVPEDKKASWKKMAEGFILRGMLSTTELTAYQQAVETTPVTMMGQYNSGENDPTSSIQNVNFNTGDTTNTYKTWRVEVARNFDADAKETALSIKKIGTSMFN